MTSQVLVSTRSTLPAAVDVIDHGTTQMEIDLRFARELATAEIVPAAYRGKPANILVAIGLGRSLGLDPASSLYGMHVIEGTPSPTAKLQASLARRAGHKVRVLESTDEKSTVQIVRADDPEYPITVAFTLDDARAAGYLAVHVERWVAAGDGGRKKPERYPLPEVFPVPCTEADLSKAGAPSWAKPWMVKRRDNWHTNRTTMLHHRAITRAVGMACPEVVSGLDFEAGDAPEVEVPHVDPVQVLAVAESAAEIAETVEPPAADIVEAEVVEEPAADIIEAVEPTLDLATEPEVEPRTADTLRARLRIDGVSQADAIREAQRVATDLGHDLPGSLAALAKDEQVLLGVVAWLDARRANTDEEPF